MLNVFARVILFFSSYVPLALIFIILYFGKSALVVSLAIVSIVIGLGGLIWIMYRAHVDVEPVPATVVNCRKRGDEVMGYVASNLIPFVGFSLLDLRQGVALIVFLFVLAYLYVTTDMIHINPILHLLGYRVYEVTLEPNLVRRTITRTTLQSGERLEFVPLSGDLLIVREKE